MRKHTRRTAEIICIAVFFVLYFFLLKDEISKVVALCVVGAALIFITLYYTLSNTQLSKKEVYAELAEAGVIAFFVGCAIYVTFFI